MSKQDAITAEYIRSILHYDPETGVFTWRERPREHFATLRSFKRCNAMYAGKPAGSVNKRGYIVLGIGKRVYAAHRLAWLWINGEWPNGDIDHIDGTTTNNAWANLRAATESQNMMNAKIRKDNKTGIKGVHAMRRATTTRYAANVTVNRRRVRIGTFDTLEEAAEKRLAAASQVYGEFARTS